MDDLFFRKKRWSMGIAIAIATILGLAFATIALAEKTFNPLSGSPTESLLPAWHAIILGVVEGATEYLPVSSTGHLLLTQRLLGGAQGAGARQAANAYAIVIQAGAILAVFGLYRARIAQIFQGLAGKSLVGQKLAVNLMVAFIPAGVMGLLFSEQIKEHLFGLWPVILAWFGGGVVLLLLNRRTLSPDSGLSIEALRWQQALGIGLLQCAALWPGVSRSLATIAGGLLVGVGLAGAVEFSFLLGLVTLGAATIYETIGSGHLIVSNYGWGTPLLGFLGAFVAAWVSVKWMVKFLQKGGLALFGWYRILLAFIVAGGLFLV